MSKPPPYDVLFVDGSQTLPNPLPTPNDISGSEILLSQTTGCRVMRIQQEFIVKFGINVKPIEAYNMLYVAEATTVPIPKVYAIYQRQERPGVVTYIFMQYVPGTTLLSLWGSLDKERKTAIAVILRTYFDQLRQLKHPGYYGDITGGPPLDDMFSETQGAHEVKTSFATEKELVDCIIRIYFLETGERMGQKSQYYQHVLPTALHGDGSPVFTHNDFQRKNIIVRPDGTPIIIDWEFASWYPSYWEYSTAMYSNNWKDDWYEYVPIALDEYPTQSLWLSSMKFEMWT